MSQDTTGPAGQGRTHGPGRARRLSMLVALAAAIGSLTVATPASAAGALTVIAHRGDAGSAPESTNPAFRAAIAKGANAIEMDVRFTRTRYPVVLHDATLDRTTNCSGAVSARSRTELRRCDAGSWYSPRYRGTRVPTLDSALRTISNRSSSVWVLLHVKDFPKGVRAKRVMNDVRRHGMTNRVVIIADTASILRKMRSAGFTELGLVFGSPAGWDSGFEYLLPYNTPLSPAGINAAHRRGGKVWVVESDLYGVRDLINIAAVDGVLVNRLGRTLRVL
jgi:glycerophosphoryl diester phosphodiesterase